MTSASNGGASLDREACVRAVKARDSRFDGVFFVGITSTGIYCRPICPARVSRADNRRFFDSAAAAERDGFRPCLRCRPELAPGRGIVHAVSRLAEAAARRIAEGALNRGSVTGLARELHVSERHLRRALVRELGVPPVELAQTHRLLLAKRLLTDSSLSMSRVAEASGFRSLRRFNASFRERYRMSPSSLRRRSRGGSRPTGLAARIPGARVRDGDVLGLEVSFRSPLRWTDLLSVLANRAIPGVERVVHGLYARTVRLEGHTGVFVAGKDRLTPAAAPGSSGGSLQVAVSIGLLPVLMPLMAGIRRLFDLDAEPRVIDRSLAAGGLDALVARRPGLRLPGAFDRFESGLSVLLTGPGAPGRGGRKRVGAVAEALGEPCEGFGEGWTRTTPRPERVAEAGAHRLAALGVPESRAHAASEFARLVADGRIALEPGAGLGEARDRLLAIDGVGSRLATETMMRAMYWPDAFPATDPTLLEVAGASGSAELERRAERWRPWRAYAAHHLWMSAAAGDDRRAAGAPVRPGAPSTAPG